MKSILGFVNDLWAMEPDRNRQLVHDLCTWDMSLRAIKQEALQQDEDEDDADDYQVVNDTAIVALHGVLMAEVPWIFALFGTAATSTRQVERQITAAEEDSDIETILLDITSPGGFVSPTQRLADRVAEASKPVRAYIENMGASAAYWIASQADMIEANRTARVGSIGILRTLVDSSERYKDQGVEVKQIKSGAHKGAGQPGTEITDEQLEPYQEIVDGMADMFVGSVAQGRGMDPGRVDELATGRLWLAGEAEDLGLIDGIGPLDLTREATDGIIPGARSMSGYAAQEGSESFEPVTFERAHPDGVPAAPEDQEWDADAEKQKVDKPDDDAMITMSGAVREDVPDENLDWVDVKLQHHEGDGEHRVVKTGVEAAKAYLGRTDGLTESEKDTIRGHLERHERRHGWDEDSDTSDEENAMGLEDLERDEQVEAVGEFLSEATDEVLAQVLPNGVTTGADEEKASEEATIDDYVQAAGGDHEMAVSAFKEGKSLTDTAAEAMQAKEERIEQLEEKVQEQEEELEERRQGAVEGGHTDGTGTDTPTGGTSDEELEAEWEEMSPEAREEYGDLETFKAVEKRDRSA